MCFLFAARKKPVHQPFTVCWPMMSWLYQHFDCLLSNLDSLVQYTIHDSLNKYLSHPLISPKEPHTHTKQWLSILFNWKTNLSVPISLDPFVIISPWYPHEVPGVSPLWLAKAFLVIHLLSFQGTGPPSATASHHSDLARRLPYPALGATWKVCPHKVKNNEGVPIQFYHVLPCFTLWSNTIWDRSLFVWCSDFPAARNMLNYQMASPNTSVKCWTMFPSVPMEPQNWCFDGTWVFIKSPQPPWIIIPQVHQLVLKCIYNI